MTLWPGADEAGDDRSMCERLELGGLTGFGDADGPVQATDETCAATYSDGMAVLTVAVRRFDDEAAAASAYAAVPALDGGTGAAGVVSGWDETRHEQGAGTGGWVTQEVLRRGTTVVEVRLELSGAIPPSAMQAAAEAVARVAAKVRALVE
ncbi:hypothetical protein AB0I28_14370 [Phytomonospora sp. NPDC050363]|uniref:hypothetical protein n=1 Tax=Phytomonospora sp. NPDC050363 TaxID=3155642 RepID=UPI0033F4D8C1